MKKIIVCGADGQLGTELVKIMKSKQSELGKLSDFYEDCIVVAVDIKDLDITDQKSAIEYINKEKPYAIVNCAAMTNVDGCEEKMEVAFKVNALGPRNLAIACSQTDTKLIHISTDYVFDGKGNKPYTETDLVAPQSAYGSTKLLGEEYVKEFCSRWFIIRTAWLYGYYGNNFVKTIAKKAKQTGELEVVGDQRGNPTNACDLAYMISKILPTDEYGIFHCTGIGECSWYEFACEIVKVFNIDAKISECTTDQSNRLAKRPQYSSLDNMMIRCSVGDEMRDWKLALKEFSKNVKIDE